jgi:hypothetical protein
MELLIDRLKEFDFKAEAVTLTTVGNFDNDVTDDEVFLKSVLMAHIANGEDVLLMLHSYAGLPGTRAIAGIDKRGREARGEQGGVLGVVYLAAFVPPESREKWDELGYKLPPWLKINVSTLV